MDNFISDIEERNQIVKEHNLNLAKVTKVELIRALQQAEGEYQCFGSNIATTCEQHNCVWRAYCA